MGVSPFAKANAAGHVGSIGKLAREGRQLLDDSGHELSVDQGFKALHDNAGSLSDAQQAQLQQLAGLIAQAYPHSDIAKLLRRDAKVTVSVAGDQMTARLTIQPAHAGGRDPEAQDVLLALRSAGVVFGVDAQALAQAIHQARQGQAVDLIAARGLPSGCGQPGHLQFWARPSDGGELQPLTAEELAQSRHVPMIVHGQDRVGCVVPAQVGQVGRTVLGAVVEPKPLATPELLAGDHVERRGNEFFAQSSGVLKLRGATLLVEPMLWVSGDLTANDPPVQFDGRVEVGGSLRSGSRLQAARTVRIKGMVEAAGIDCGGDLLLHSGVAGQGRAVLHAGGDIKCRYAESATLHAGRDVLIEAGAMHCRLVAGRSINASEGRGHIVGGSIIAAHAVIVRHLGSDLEVPMEIIVGVDAQTLSVITDLQTQMETLQEHQRRCREVADRMQMAVGNPTRLPQATLQTYVGLRTAEIADGQRLTALQRQCDELINHAPNIDQARVEVLGHVMRGVTIRIGPAHYTVTSPLRHRKFCLDPHSRQVVATPL